MSITEVESVETQLGRLKDGLLWVTLNIPVAFDRGMNVASKCLTFHMNTFLAKFDFTTEDLLEKTDVYF